MLSVQRLLQHEMPDVELTPGTLQPCLENSGAICEIVMKWGGHFTNNTEGQSYMAMTILSSAYNY